MTNKTPVPGPRCGGFCFLFFRVRGRSDRCCRRADFFFKWGFAPVARGGERGYARLSSLLRAKREPEKHQRFRRAGSDGLRYPASTSCLGRHSCPADRGPNSSSLFPPQAAVVAVARKGLLAPFRPRRGSRNGKKLVAALNAFFSFLRFAASQLVLPLC